MATYQRTSSWADLAPDLLELILQRLTLMDYLKCREICSTWRKAVNDALAAKGRCPPLSQLPFLLTISRDNPAKLLSLTQHRVLTMSTQSWVGLIDKVQSVHGWLMFNRFYYVSGTDQTSCEISFFNPVSRAMLKLPGLSLFSGRWSSYHSNRIAFASAPDSPEFLVVFFISVSHQNQVKQRLAFCKASRESWTSIDTVETQTNTFRDIAVHDVKLYATTLDVMDFVIIFNLGNASAITVERLVMLDPKPVRMLGHFEFNGDIRHDTDQEICLLGMDTTRGELFLVFHLRDSIMNIDTRKFSFWTKGFRVFKLDLSGPRWIEVKHLGDRFFFSDWTGVRIISARDLDGAQEFSGGNCIFFCMLNRLPMNGFPEHDIGVFFLADKSIKRFPVSSSYMFTARTPRISQHINGLIFAKFCLMTLI